MEKITIRKAEASDLPVLLRFEQGVIQAERPLDSTLKATDTHYYDLDIMLTSSHINLVVAEEGGVVIGSGYARIESAKPYLQHRQHVYLGFMYVEPTYRGKGVNQMIIEALREWTVSQNITEMRLDVYYENQPAIKAYEKVGFIKHMIEMRMGI